MDEKENTTTDTAIEQSNADTAAAKDTGRVKPEFTESMAFTPEQQEYVDYLTKKEFAKGATKARRELPPKEDLDAFKAWKESQQTEAEKQAQLLKDLETAKNEKVALEIKTRLLEEGIPKDLVKYAMLDIQEAGGDVDTGIAAFKASDIYKVGQAARNYGAPAQVTDIKNHTAKSVSDLMREANEHPERLSSILAQVETLNQKK